MCTGARINTTAVMCTGARIKTTAGIAAAAFLCFSTNISGNITADSFHSLKAGALSP